MTVGNSHQQKEEEDANIDDKCPLLYTEKEGGGIMQMRKSRERQRKISPDFPSFCFFKSKNGKKCWLEVKETVNAFSSPDRFLQCVLCVGRRKEPRGSRSLHPSFVKVII